MLHFCPNCNTKNTAQVREVLVLQGSVRASLRHCAICDFLYLSAPDWLEKAYENEFFGDTGYVQRNLGHARFLRFLMMSRDLYLGFGLYQVCDLGTGLGMLPRLMRDYGYDFYGEDKFAGMQLIRPFINPLSSSQVFTAFEVVEHIPSLPQFLKDNILNSELFVFSTLLREDGKVPHDDWWYYTFELGQHISFHSKKSLVSAMEICGIAGDRLVSVDNSLHALILDKKWKKPFRLAKLLTKARRYSPIIFLLQKFYSRPSLTWTDHLNAIKKKPL